jgi:geranylgeranyl transferase type-2 subunit alpha
MHGVPRNRVVDAKEQEQKRKKIEKWNGFKKQIFEERQNGVLTKDQIEKQEYKNLLLLSPEFYSFWNYRKEIITNLVKNIDNEEDKKAIYKKELELTEQVLKERHTKSYGTWHHRKWCITHLPEAWNNELLLTDKLLSYDSRNCK